MFEKTPLNHDDGRLVQAFHRLNVHLIQALLGSNISSAQSPIVYVDTKTGNDLTGRRGSFINKFATITAALAAAVSGDIIDVAAGTYAENVVLPATIGMNVTLQGAGPGHTIISPSVAGAGLSYSGGVYGQLTVRRMSVYASGANAALSVVNTGVSTSTVIIDDAELISATAAAVITDVATLVLRHVLGTTGGLTLSEIGIGSLSDAISSVTVQYREASKIAGNAPAANSGVSVSDSMLGAVTLGTGADNLGRLYLGDSVKVAGAITGNLSDNAAGTDWGEFTFSGRSTYALGTACQLQVDFDVAASKIPIDMRMSLFEDNVYISAPTSNERIDVDMRNSSVSGSVTAGASTDIDIRGGTYESIAVISTGTVDRTIDIVDPDLNNNTHAYTFTVPYPAGAVYNVHYEITVAATPLTTVKTATAFTVTSSVDDTTNGRAIIIRPND